MIYVFVVQAKNTNTVMVKFSGFASYLIAFATTFLYSSAPFADVTLSSKFGNLVVTGELVEFESGFYTLRTEDGILTLRERDVTCRGLRCPVLEEFSQTISISPGHHIDKFALLKLIKAFIKRDGLRFIQQGDSANPDHVEISDPSGSKIFEVFFEKTDNAFWITSNSPDIAFANVAIQIVSSAQSLKDGLTPSELEKIWNGTYDNWTQIGGSDQKIRVLAPVFSEEIQSVFRNYAQSPIVKLGGHVELFLSSNQILSEIENDPTAIGFLVSASEITLSVPIEHCGRSIKLSGNSKAYPLQTTIGLSSNAERLPLMAEQMIDFLRFGDSEDVLKDIDLLKYQPKTQMDCDISSQ